MDKIYLKFDLDSIDVAGYLKKMEEEKTSKKSKIKKRKRNLKNSNY